MLQKGVPADVIEDETGASRATIFRRKAALRGDEIPAAAESGKKTMPAAPAPVDVYDPVATATAAYLAGLSPLAIAAALGVDAYALDPDAVGFGLINLDISRRRLERLAAKADALERMRKHRPAQWAKLVAQEEEAERRVALDSRLPVEVWTGFWADVVSHQAGILIERDFIEWMGWVSDLVEKRHTQMPK